MGGCATKPKDLKQDASEAPLPQQEEVPGEHKALQEVKPRAVVATEDDKPPKAEDAAKEAGVGETPEKAAEAGEEEEEEGKKKQQEVDVEEAEKDASVGSGKEEWHLDDNKRRSLGVLFMEDDGESVDGSAAAETSGQKESDESTPVVVVVERSVEVILEEKESKKAEGSRPEDEVAKPEDTAKAEETADQEVVPHPVAPVVEPAVESQEKAITSNEAPPTGKVPEENPKPEESTKDVVENVESTEDSNQNATGADSIEEAIVIAATPLSEDQVKQPEQQHTASGETSSEVHHVEAAGERRDVVLEEQQKDAEIAVPATANDTGSLPVVLEQPVEKIEAMEEKSKQTPPPPPVDVVVDEAAVVSEKVSNNVIVDEPAAQKLESVVEDSKPTSMEMSGDEKAAGETVKAAAVAASDAEKEADDVDKAAAAATSDEPAALKLESAVEDSKTGDQEATGEPDKAAPAASGTEKGSSAIDDSTIANVKQEAGQDGDELPLSTTGSTAA